MANEKLLIDAKKLPYSIAVDDNGKQIFYVKATDIDNAPTVDAVEVVHGRWIHDYNNLYGCSECMERETMSPKKLKNYCPNCGAKMRGSEE